jgi:hypothetical protein
LLEFNIGHHDTLERGIVVMDRPLGKNQKTNLSASPREPCSHGEAFWETIKKTLGFAEGWRNLWGKVKKNLSASPREPCSHGEAIGEKSKKTFGFAERALQSWRSRECANVRNVRV